MYPLPRSTSGVSVKCVWMWGCVCVVCAIEKAPVHCETRVGRNQQPFPQPVSIQDHLSRGHHARYHGARSASHSSLPIAMFWVNLTFVLVSMNFYSSMKDCYMNEMFFDFDTLLFSWYLKDFRKKTILYNFVWNRVFCTICTNHCECVTRTAKTQLSSDKIKEKDESLQDVFLNCENFIFWTKLILLNANLNSLLELTISYYYFWRPQGSKGECQLETIFWKINL